MRILLITQYFYPENFKSNDVAIELSKRGHEVTVLTGLPNYPAGKIFDNYRFFGRNKEKLPGIKIIRTWIVPRGNGGAVRLFLNYFSWAFFASFRIFFLALSSSFDSVIVHAPSPVTQFVPAIIIKKIQRIPIYFWILDLWPESLTSAGGIKNKFILDFFTEIVKYFYRVSDKILISSQSFKSSIIDKGDFEDKLIYFPNWAEDTISKGSNNYPIPKLPNGFNILFAGNLGVAQDLESVVNCAVKLKEYKNIHFIILGDGRMKKTLEKSIIKNNVINNVHLMGKYPIEAMKTFFHSADSLLITLKNEEALNKTVPAKLQAYMSSGRPILGMLSGEGNQTIKESKGGFTANAGEYENLAKLILKLTKLTQNQRDVLGNNSLKFYQDNFELKKCIDDLEIIIRANIVQQT